MTETTIENGRGPVGLILPSSYDEAQPLPLIVALHGYTSNSDDTTFYFDLVSQIESRPFLYLAPDGNVDSEGNPFWNATDACGDFNNTQVDDSSYLQELVNLVRSQYSVDEQSIHFIGVSNGGFMSYRMACDHSCDVWQGVFVDPAESGLSILA